MQGKLNWYLVFFLGKFTKKGKYSNNHLNDGIYVS